MSRRPPWADYEPTPEEFEGSLLDMIESGDEFIEWVSCEALADDIREPSIYFPEAGGISTVEMFRKACAGEFTAEQCRDVFRTLVERFKDARLEQINEHAGKLAERSFKADFAELSREQRTTVRAAMARAESGSFL